MYWSYKNDSDCTILYRDSIWQPGDELQTPYPVPASLGLTCTQEGDALDPVLFHDDVILQAGQSRSVNIKEPALSHSVSLTILCMTTDNGVECRFNSSNNKPVPIDTRGFQQVLNWELCSKLVLHNPTETEAIISITAFEVV